MSRHVGGSLAIAAVRAMTACHDGALGAPASRPSRHQ
jgi:hypothetical protein